MVHLKWCQGTNQYDLACLILFIETQHKQSPKTQVYWRMLSKIWCMSHFKSFQNKNFERGKRISCVYAEGQSKINGTNILISPSLWTIRWLTAKQHSFQYLNIKSAQWGYQTENMKMWAPAVTALLQHLSATDTRKRELTATLAQF